ncbi:TlpA disulfide reductase family protein [Telmatospirillum sp. J64-1]|uniref:TlpA disulfide reductase family protein n=1 Tax=Telmatospirillum sp. J64-1 TaxID=2502183 RepID=UPI00115CA1DE|nr:TlpA disulfide reductase family protein [Telmatospirillum sp. J64-1]
MECALKVFASAALIAGGLAAAPSTAWAGGYTIPPLSESRLDITTVNSGIHFAELGKRRQVPDITVTDPSGAAIRLNLFRGRTVLLHFWSSTCGPCIKTLAGLDHVQQVMGGPRFQVMAVSVDPGGIAAARSFLRQQKVENLRPYADINGTAVSAMYLRSLPTSFVIDAQGGLAMLVEGATKWDSPEIMAHIQAIATGQ